MRLLSIMLTFACGESSTGFSDKIEDTAPEAVGASVEPYRITWIDIDEGVSSATEFVVSNVGEAALDIERIDITNSGGGAFDLDEEANRNIVLQSVRRIQPSLWQHLKPVLPWVSFVSALTMRILQIIALNCAHTPGEMQYPIVRHWWGVNPSG